MYKYIELRNGIKIGLYRMDSVKSVAMKAMLTAGPVIEDDVINGASHFIEHIVLGGTKSYPTKLAFATAFEDLGVSYGGYTSIQEMGFEFDIPYTNLFKTIDILKEIIFEPAFTREIVDKERSIILEEMQDRENSPDHQFLWKMLEMRFKDKSHPLTKKVIGTRETIENIAFEKLQELYSKTFVPNNLYLTIVGNFDLDEVESYVRNIFENIESKVKFVRPVFSNDDLSGYMFESIEDDKFSNVYSNLAFSGYSREIPEKQEMALRIFNAMFTGLRTSRLFQDVREKEGLVYNISSDWYNSWGVGAFSISFESDSSKVERIMEIVYKDIEDVKRNGFRDDELLRVRNYFNNRTLLSFSSPSKINSWLMDYIYENMKVTFPEEVIEIGNNIQHDDINQAIHDLFDFSTLNVLMMGKLGKFDLSSTLNKISIPISTKVLSK